MYRRITKPWQKKEALTSKHKQKVCRLPVHRRAAFFRRCGKRKR